MKPILIWYRNDLRVHDHEALFRAQQSNRPLLALYCFEPSLLEQTVYGFDKTGAHRLRFMVESVLDLRENLKKLGVTLLIKYGQPEIIFKQLYEKYQFEAVYFHKALGSEEFTVERRVKNSLKDVTFNHYYGHSLYHPEDLPFQLQDLPDVYTAFRKKIEKAGRVREVYKLPSL